MQIVNRVLPRKHTLVLSSDWHVGNNACSVDMIKAVINRVADDDDCYLALGGDQIEAITTDDPRFTDTSHIPKGQENQVTPLKQTGFIQELLEPIADKIVVINHGNHEDKLFRTGNFTELLCEGLQVQYGTYTSKVHVHSRVGNSDKKREYSLLYWHGYGSVNSRVDDPRQRRRNKLRSVRRKLRGFADDCEIMAMGHVHDLLLETPEATLRLHDDGDEIVGDYSVFPTVETQKGRYIHPDARWYCVTGTALKTQMEGYTTYSEKHGYSPSQLGWAEVHYDADADGRGIEMELVRYGLKYRS